VDWLRLLSREFSIRRPKKQRRSAPKAFLLDHVYHKLKVLVRPLSSQRRLLERAKYLGTPILSSQAGNDLLAASFGRPLAIGKIGAGEMAALRHHLRGADSNGDSKSWGGHAARNLYRIAGVYPPEPEIYSRFCQLYARALASLDVLAVWFNFGEHAAHSRFLPRARLTQLDALEPYYNDRPWSGHLAGKRVLVVSPFATTIEEQYRRRRVIWRAKPEVLPDFELRTVRVPLSSYVAPPAYPDWFAALDAMCGQMAAAPFDAAIIGAGAWSIPLVAHAKSLGKWAIHLGGVTQILFGIKGQRWEKNQRIMAFCNEAWVRPAAGETPQNVKAIEGGCYW
jgi:hypothetical protein